ncbi:MoeA, N-terminal and linker domain-containing protein [Neurospora crassa]|nr:MoeA, N-terminal and linker domain-containing protein [Neurospora crassa]
MTFLMAIMDKRLDSTEETGVVVTPRTRFTARILWAVLKGLLWPLVLLWILVESAVVDCCIPVCKWCAGGCMYGGTPKTKYWSKKILKLTAKDRNPVTNARIRLLNESQTRRCRLSLENRAGGPDCCKQLEKAQLERLLTDVILTISNYLSILPGRISSAVRNEHARYSIRSKPKMHTTPLTTMAMQYQAALQILQKTANDMSKRRTRTEELVPLEDSVGRTAAKDILSPDSTPPFDTAAADGFALVSSATINASPMNPVYFRVAGTITAGEEPPLMPPCRGPDGVLQCYEIMVGARFPDTATEHLIHMDACVWATDVQEVSGSEVPKADPQLGNRFIKITKPVTYNANRRRAGEDISKGDRLIRAGMKIRSSHVLPLASVGIKEVAVEPLVRVGVWSTGREIVRSHVGGPTATKRSGTRYTYDADGPYLMAALKEFGAEPHFLGLLPGDDPAVLEKALGETMATDKFDVLVTTGAATPGRSGFVRSVIEKLGGQVHFHGVAMRPGGTALFASLESTAPNNGLVSFFGLPGDPCAMAASFRFLIVPYLQFVRGEKADEPLMTTLELRCSTRQESEPNMDAGAPVEASMGNGCGPLCMDCFRHGRVTASEDGRRKVVRMTKDQGPGKVYPFIEANCWIHLPHGQEIVQGAMVPCLSLSACRDEKWQ